MENNGKKNSNVVAIVGFILSFFIGTAGLICSIVGLVKSKELKDGKGFSIAGIIISSIRILFTLFVILIAVIIAFKESRDMFDYVKNDIIENVEESIDENVENDENETNSISVIANDKTYNVTFVYIKEPTNHFNDSEYDINYITRVYVKINDIEVKEYSVIYRYGTNYENLTGENIKVLKGKDKDYFVLLIPEDHYDVDGRTNPTIVNEEGNILYTIEYPINTGMIVTDTKSIMYDKGMYYVDNDKFYFIKPYCDNNSQDKFREYTLTVDNDIVNVIEGNIVEGISAGGLVCPES